MFFAQAAPSVFLEYIYKQKPTVLWPVANHFWAHWPFLDQKSEKSFCEEDHAALVNQESEQSDDELLTLSSPHGSANGDKHHGAKKPSKKQQEPAAPAPPEDVDLLGLEGSAVSKNFSPPLAPPTNSELLSDLFGGVGAAGPGQSGVEDVFHPSGPASAQSTPRRSATSTSASPTLRGREGKFFPCGTVLTSQFQIITFWAKWAEWNLPTKLDFSRLPGGPSEVYIFI